MRYFFLLAVFVLKGLILNAQGPVQIVKGTVSDRLSNAPVPFATVALLSARLSLTTKTDSSGNFSFAGVAVDRYNIQVSCIGYETAIIPEIMVTSSKEVFVHITLNENAATLKEVVVKPGIIKNRPLNPLATAGARMLSVEEAKRYAGGFDDPARLASAFAGVAGNIGNNGIVIRGNAPQYLQWKMEGVEIPNPNHFADVIVFGGGGLTALSSLVLANSDFFTGAFPAEYSNALSGVFDIFMRNGNHERREHSFQVGITGIDFSSEGPLSKSARSSYLFNYRYSTLALAAPVLPENAGGVRYQDLSFKLNIPVKNAGAFSLWGIGLIDRSGAKAEKDRTKWEYDTDPEEQDIRQYMGAAGISYKHFISKKAYWKTTLAATISVLDYTTSKLDSHLLFLPQNHIKNTNCNLVFSSSINKKFSVGHTNKTGILITGMQYDLLTKDTAGPAQPLRTIVNENGFSTVVSAYSHSNIRLSNRLLINAGVNAQLFTLNNHYTVEPRVGIKWHFNSTQSLGIGYGLHSRLEKLNFYFTRTVPNGGTLINKQLDFSKAHHLVAAYDISAANDWHIKVEPYYQWLFNIPVIADSSFSFINMQNDWFFDQRITNKGKGKNYGIDITVERFFKRGFYWMITASVFDSKYKGGDNKWYNTRFNRNYVVNLLAGKEWSTGKNRQKVWGLNGRFVYQGGNRYSPVNEASSLASKEVVYDETRAFQKQDQPAFVVHFTASFKINKASTSHEFALKVINLTQQKDFFGYRYNHLTHRIDKNAEALFIPNLSWKVEF